MPNARAVDKVAALGAGAHNPLSRGMLLEYRTGLGRPRPLTVKGKRDHAALALLAGCFLRRSELAALQSEDIQLCENRWVIANFRGQGGRVRTVAVPPLVKQAVDAWPGLPPGRSGSGASEPKTFAHMHKTMAGEWRRHRADQVHARPCIDSDH